jgi:hypothetical protein
MKRLMLACAVAVAGAGCGKEAEKPKEVPPAGTGGDVKPTRPEGPHMLVTSGSQVTVKADAVVLVKITRDGTIEPRRFNYSGGKFTSEIRGGAASQASCCQPGEPAEIKAIAGEFKRLAVDSKVPEGGNCDEPVMIDGDHRAPWARLRKIIEILGRAKMTRALFATKTDKESLAGVPVRLPEDWDITAAPPAEARRVGVAAKGQDVEFTVDGARYADVASAAKALSGAKSLALDPADPKTPLWAVVKGVELALAVAPAEPVRFVLPAEK